MVDHAVNGAVDIRTACADDLDRLAQIYRASSLSNDRDRAPLLASPGALEFAGRFVADGLTRVATIGETIVGFATAVGAGPAVELEDLFVDPDYMRLGVATALFADAVASARAAGRSWIEVTANPHAHLFYESVGLVTTGAVTTEFGDGARMGLNLK